MADLACAFPDPARLRAEAAAIDAAIEEADGALHAIERHVSPNILLTAGLDDGTPIRLALPLALVRAQLRERVTLLRATRDHLAAEAALQDKVGTAGLVAAGFTGPGGLA